MVSGTNGQSLTQTVWSDQDTFMLGDDAAKIYLYPSYKAGNDIIHVTVGDRTWSIPLVVKPGTAAGVAIDAPESL